MSASPELVYSKDAYPPVSPRSGELWSSWGNEDFYTQVIEPIGIAASKPGNSVRDALRTLWEANCNSISKAELLGTSRPEDRAVALATKNIRQELPLELSLYYLEKDSRLVLMPTIPDYTDVLFPEDVTSIKEEGYPEETLPFVIWLNQRQARPKYAKTKATTIFSKASENVIKLGGLMAKNFAQQMNVGQIIEELGLSNPKEVYSYMGKLAELVSKYPGEIRFSLKRTEGKEEHDACYALEYESEEEAYSNAHLGETGLKVRYPEIAQLLDKYHPLEALAIIDPTGINPDARMHKEADPTRSWEYFYTQLAIAQEECLISLRTLLELAEEPELNSRVQDIVVKVEKAFNETQTRYKQQDQTQESITHLVNDVTISSVLELLSGADSPIVSETPEIAWQMVKEDRDNALRLTILREFLLTNSFSNQDMETVIPALLNIYAEFNDSEFEHHFYTTPQDMINVMMEMKRLDGLKKVASAYIQYGPLADPKGTLNKAKVKKGDNSYHKVLTSLRNVYSSHVRLFALLTPEKERPAVYEVLQKYKILHETQNKQSLAGRRIVTEYHDISIPGRGNLERVEIVGMSIDRNNLIPIRVLNPKYKVISGPERILRDANNLIELGDDGLPLLYTDNVIVSSTDPEGRNPVTSFQSL